MKIKQPDNIRSADQLELVSMLPAPGWYASFSAGADVDASYSLPLVAWAEVVQRGTMMQDSWLTGLVNDGNDEIVPVQFAKDPFLSYFGPDSVPDQHEPPIVRPRNTW